MPARDLCWPLEGAAGSLYGGESGDAGRAEWYGGSLTTARPPTGWNRAVSVTVSVHSAYIGQSDHIFILTESIKYRARHGRSTYCAFLDIRKAFPTMHRASMLAALSRAGIGGKVWRIAFCDATSGGWVSRCPSKRTPE